MLDRFRASRRQHPEQPVGGTTTTANATTAGAAGPASALPTSVDGPLREKPSRFQEASDLEAGTAGTSNGHGLHHGHNEYAGAHSEKMAAGEPMGWVDPYGPAPGFKKWVKLYWHDVVA